MGVKDWICIRVTVRLASLTAWTRAAHRPEDPRLTLRRHPASLKSRVAGSGKHRESLELAAEQRLAVVPQPALDQACINTPKICRELQVATLVEIS